MDRPSQVKLSASHGVELWRLVADGPEQFAVRSSHRRARTFGSLSAAQSLYAQLVNQAVLARAH
jgi:hypothetical protein